MAAPTPSRRDRPGPAASSIAIAVTAVIAVAAGCSRPNGPAVVAIPGSDLRGLAATVEHVIDGDTIDVRFGAADPERVRLLGIDTPETVKPDTPVQCFGPEASSRTKALLPPDTEVVVQRDDEARDRYGRLLVYVWRRRDGLFVNRSLVADGYARTLSISPNTAHRVDLSAAAAAARSTGSGLWGACPEGG